MAKTVMVKLDGHMVMVVLPANHRIDFEVLLGETNAEAADLASEAEFEDLFPGCEVGAMPPFGNLYGLKVWVEETLADSDMIAFNAGSHTEVIQLQFTDFEALVQPKLISALSNPATD
jgi:Ala-tRNA(Pro) deacylase